MKNVIAWCALVFIAAIFSSCGIQNKFASSFGKRRYTKGFYVDMPARKHTVALKTTALQPVNRITDIRVRNSNIVNNNTISLPLVHAAAVSYKSRQTNTQNVCYAKNSAIATIMYDPSISSHHYTDKRNDEKHSYEVSFSFISLLLFTLWVIVLLILFFPLGGSDFLLILTAIFYFGSAITSIIALIRHEPNFWVALLVLGVDAFIAGLLFAAYIEGGP